jgi:hypothetical protein
VTGRPSALYIGNTFKHMFFQNIAGVIVEIEQLSNAIKSLHYSCAINLNLFLEGNQWP